MAGTELKVKKIGKLEKKDKLQAACLRSGLLAAKRIMVIDDDPNIRSLLKYRLEREGYGVLLAEDGVDALKRVKLELPDLIILDLSLPRLNGFGFLELLGGETEVKSIPVIILSVYGNEKNRRRGAELGAAEFVVKPFSPRELIAKVGRILETASASGN